jgi:hypothetical protein
MEEQNKKQRRPSSQTTLMDEEELRYLKELQELPYSNDKVGQAFCMPYSIPSHLKKPAPQKKDPEKEQ